MEQLRERDRQKEVEEREISLWYREEVDPTWEDFCPLWENFEGAPGGVARKGAKTKRRKPEVYPHCLGMVSDSDEDEEELGVLNVPEEVETSV